MSAQVQNNVKKITLEVGDNIFNFTMSREAYNKYLNSIMPNNKVAPHHNLLVTTADENCRESLVTFLKDHPGAEMDLGGELINAYTPDLNVVVKTSSSAQNV